MTTQPSDNQREIENHLRAAMDLPPLTQPSATPRTANEVRQVMLYQNSLGWRVQQLETELAAAKELLREIRDNEVNASDEADKFLRDHQPSALAVARAECERLKVTMEGFSWAPDMSPEDARAHKTVIHTATLDAMEAELARLRADYERACQTVAQMHAAAVGEVCGPRRGVVEDVVDLRAEVERLTERLSDVANSHARELHRADGAEDRAERAEAQLAAMKTNT